MVYHHIARFAKSDATEAVPQIGAHLTKNKYFNFILTFVRERVRGLNLEMVRFSISYGEALRPVN